MSNSPFIVSADWLEERLDNPTIKILDASWYLPDQGRDAKAEYDAAHIPGAIFFDQDLVVAAGSALPHTLPSPQEFQRYAQTMGLCADDTIVVYDGPGYFSAPRVWWMLRTMGAKKVFVLDGGFDNWKAQGRPTTDAPSVPVASTFTAKLDADRVIDFRTMLATVTQASSQIADARGAGRFSGEQPEPRAGMRSGHMPGARNVPYASLSENGYLKNLDQLRATLVRAGIDPEQPVVTTCGSGVTACVIALALESLGNNSVRVYDGSWCEWGARDNTTIVTGGADE
ncbi:MAG: 3-mercaptopyruvate sulfurtransferase [Ahrensia sp.]